MGDSDVVDWCQQISMYSQHTEDTDINIPEHVFESLVSSLLGLVDLAEIKRNSLDVRLVL